MDNSGGERVDKQPLQEASYRRIRQAIMDGTIPPGRRLSEPELALLFHVSRSPVREALVRLEQDGFVVRGPSGRISVAPLDIDELEQLYVVRANLEGLATYLAASRLRTIDLQDMSAKIGAMRRLVEDGDFPAAIEVGQAFHEIILRECANTPLLDVLTNLRGRINRFRTLAASFTTYDIERLDEHARILDALYRRQSEEAKEEMVHHINASAAVLVTKLRERVKLLRPNPRSMMT